MHKPISHRSYINAPSPAGFFWTGLVGMLLFSSSLWAESHDQLSLQGAVKGRTYKVGTAHSDHKEHNYDPPSSSQADAVNETFRVKQENDETNRDFQGFKKNETLVEQFRRELQEHYDNYQKQKQKNQKEVAEISAKLPTAGLIEKIKLTAAKSQIQARIADQSQKISQLQGQLGTLDDQLNQLRQNHQNHAEAISAMTTPEYAVQGPRHEEDAVTSSHSFQTQQSHGNGDSYELAQASGERLLPRRASGALERELIDSLALSENGVEGFENGLDIPEVSSTEILEAQLSGSDSNGNTPNQIDLGLQTATSAPRVGEESSRLTVVGTSPSSSPRGLSEASEQRISDQTQRLLVAAEHLSQQRSSGPSRGLASYGNGSLSQNRNQSKPTMRPAQNRLPKKQNRGLAQQALVSLSLPSRTERIPEDLKRAMNQNRRLIGGSNARAQTRAPQTPYYAGF